MNSRFIADVGDSLFRSRGTADTPTHQFYQSGLLHLNGFRSTSIRRGAIQYAQIPGVLLLLEMVLSK